MSVEPSDQVGLKAEDVIALSSKLMVRRPTRQQLDALIDEVSPRWDDVAQAIAYLSVVALIEALVRRGWVTPGLRLGDRMQPHRDTLKWLGIAKTIDREDIQQMLDAACEASEAEGEA